MFAPHYVTYATEMHDSSVSKNKFLNYDNSLLLSFVNHKIRLIRADSLEPGY